jgi:hypothetical protein
MTILPRGWPSSRYRTASGASINGKVRSITGVTFPASIRSVTVRRSSCFSFEASPRNLYELFMTVTHDDASVVGQGCDDQFEFALDLLLDGLERLKDRS